MADITKLMNNKKNVFSAVDDHFAKALGDTWVKLQKEEYQKKRKETAAAAADGRQKVNVYAA